MAMMSGGDFAAARRGLNRLLIGGSFLLGLLLRFGGLGLRLRRQHGGLLVL
jgi:hypothetical protein